MYMWMSEAEGMDDKCHFMNVCASIELFILVWDRLLSEVLHKSIHVHFVFLNYY